MEEIPDRNEHYLLKRDGRFLVAALRTPHQVLSTSACSGGMTGGVRFLVNHQSCEGQGHLERFEWMKEIGETGYHRHVCEELDQAVRWTRLYEDPVDMPTELSRFLG